MSKDEAAQLSELRQIMLKIQSASRDHIAKLRISEPLEADLKSFLAQIKNELAAIPDGGKRPSESLIEREALGHHRYRDKLREVVMARLDTLEAERRYENLVRWWDTARSELAYNRETVKHGIFSEGG